MRPAEAVLAIEEVYTALGATAVTIGLEWNGTRWTGAATFVLDRATLAGTVGHAFAGLGVEGHLEMPDLLGEQYAQVTYRIHGLAAPLGKREGGVW